MVYETSVNLKVDINVTVLDEATNEIIPLMDFVVATVNAKQPNYIMGDSMTVSGDTLTFSQRYPLTATRQEIIDFVTALQPYCLGGMVKAHNCNHDIGGSCESATEILRFGVTTWEL